MQEEAEIERIIAGTLEENDHPPDLSSWKGEEGYVSQYEAALAALFAYARNNLDRKKALEGLNSGIQEERSRQMRETGGSLSYLIRQNPARYDFLMQQRIEAGMAKALSEQYGGMNG